MKRAAWITSVLCASLWACGGGDDSGGGPAGGNADAGSDASSSDATDATPDAMVETGPDAEPDAHDAASDTAEDALSDVAQDVLDAGHDAAADVTEDAQDAGQDVASDVVEDAQDGGQDAPVDGPTDSSEDALSDAPVDATPDGPVDVGVDAPEDAEDASGTGGVWVEIDYSSAYTSQSPSWSFSATPGWGGAQWAPDGWSWPEAWDRFDNMTVQYDPMGSKALMIGSSSQLQLMIGLEELAAYDHATVRLEGRSYSTSSPVTFEVSNPINGCAVTGSMSNDWTIHVEELDFGQCLVAGTGLQAVRVDTSSGTLALVRMRVTLHDASW